MRRTIRITIAGLLAACIAAGEAAPDPNANAALDWWRAISSLAQDGDRLGRLGEDDALKAPLPDPAVDAAFAQPQRALNLLALGAAAPYCDWGIDARAEGADALLPYTQPLRRLVRLALLRARWQASQQRHAEAVDDVLLALRVGRLMGGRTPLLMDVLAGAGVETQAIAVAGALLPTLDAPSRQRLEAGFAALPASATVADALGNEAAFVQWAVDRMLAMPPVKRPAFFTALGGGGSALDALRLLPEVADEKLKPLPAAYAEELARMQALMRKPPAERLPFPEPWGGKPPHPLFAVAAPAIGGIVAHEVQLLQRRQQLRAALARLAGGDAALAAHPDILTGRPFACAATPTGFRLSAPAIQQGKPIVLEVGMAAAAADKAPAPSGF